MEDGCAGRAGAAQRARRRLCGARLRRPPFASPALFSSHATHGHATLATLRGAASEQAPNRSKAQRESRRHHATDGASVRAGFDPALAQTLRRQS